ncbi:metallophosphoesterase [bacterium]|nr:metallophosphoesterase [bacterium]
MNNSAYLKTIFFIILTISFCSLATAIDYKPKQKDGNIVFWGPHFFNIDDKDKYLGISMTQCNSRLKRCKKKWEQDRTIAGAGTANPVIARYTDFREILCFDNTSKKCHREGVEYYLKLSGNYEEQTTVSKLENVTKWYAISDVHGSLRSFMYLLLAGEIITWGDGRRTHRETVENNLCHFVDKKNICLDWWRYDWNFDDGHLIIVGDVMDGDDHHLEILWAIRYLEEKSKGKVHFLLGNHEEEAIIGSREKDRLYEVAMADQLKGDDRIPIKKGLVRELYGAGTILGKWLRSRNFVLQVNNDLFVHGGISPAFIVAARTDHLMYDGANITWERINQELKTLYNLEAFPPDSRAGYHARGKIKNEELGIDPTSDTSLWVYNIVDDPELAHYIQGLTFRADPSADIDTSNRRYSYLWAYGYPCSPLHYRGYWMRFEKPKEDIYKTCAVQTSLSNSDVTNQIHPLAPPEKSTGDASGDTRSTNIFELVKLLNINGFEPQKIITGHTEERSGSQGEIRAISVGIPRMYDSTSDEALGKRMYDSTTDTAVFLIDTGISSRHGKKEEYDFFGEGLMYDEARNHYRGKTVLDATGDLENTIPKTLYYRVEPRVSIRRKEVRGLIYRSFKQPDKM